MILNLIKYTIIIFALCQFLTQYSYGYSLPLFNDTLSKKGFTKKQPFNINIGYEYNNTNGFKFIQADTTNGILTISNSAMRKISHGIKAEAEIYITPFFKIFTSYTFRKNLIDIEYKLNKSENIILIKDYTSNFLKTSSEHIYMAGFEAEYNWTINKYSPYISLKAGFGSTVSESYEDIFYNASFTLKAGTYIKFNKNYILNIYTGADYTTLFNNGLMIENINIYIPDDYIILGAGNYFNADIEYQENYEKNINMILGAELNIYKYVSIFAEIKYINSLIVYTGIKAKF